MKTEYEIVFTQIQREKLVDQIKYLGGLCIKENTFMKRYVFEIPNNPRESFVRVRDEGGKITCTYKEENLENFDINRIQELETEVKDFEIMRNIFLKIGLRQKSYQETYREIWNINGEIEIMIDSWPGLKPYVEIEGKNEADVKKYSELLGFDYSTGIFGTVFEIYEKELGLGYEYINNLPEITFRNFPKPH